MNKIQLIISASVNDNYFYADNTLCDTWRKELREAFPELDAVMEEEYGGEANSISHGPSFSGVAMTCMENEILMSTEECVELINTLSVEEGQRYSFAASLLKRVPIEYYDKFGISSDFEAVFSRLSVEKLESLMIHSGEYSRIIRYAGVIKVCESKKMREHLGVKKYDVLLAAEFDLLCMKNYAWLEENLYLYAEKGNGLIARFIKSIMATPAAIKILAESDTLPMEFKTKLINDFMVNEFDFLK